MVTISQQITPADYKKAQTFLLRIKPVLTTGDCTFATTAKNKSFERQFSLRHEQKIKIIKSLTADDCIKVEPNNNPRFEKSEIYVFLKCVTLPVYGEDESHTIYIKIYLVEMQPYDSVIVISFHEEGQYD